MHGRTDILIGTIDESGGVRGVSARVSGEEATNAPPQSCEKKRVEEEMSMRQE